MIKRKEIRKSARVGATVAIAVWTIWYVMGDFNHAFRHVQENWIAAAVMAFGSIIAGGTSMGGGAVAFPIFTKVLHMSSMDAKVFALAIQSVGMTAASISIVTMAMSKKKIAGGADNPPVYVDWRVIFWTSLGGAPGIICGSRMAAFIQPEVIRMCYTAMVTSFAFTLAAVSLKSANAPRRPRTVHPELHSMERQLLTIAGFSGGVMGGLVGSGIDFLAFSVLVLLFHFHERAATHTSVIIMTINAVIGFAYHYFIIGGFNQIVQACWLAAIPAVVVGAPLGAMICAALDRQYIILTLLVLISMEFVSSVCLIPLTRPAVLSGFFTFFAFSFIYYLMHHYKTFSNHQVFVDANPSRK